MWLVWAALARELAGAAEWPAEPEGACDVSLLQQSRFLAAEDAAPVGLDDAEASVAAALNGVEAAMQDAAKVVAKAAADLGDANKDPKVEEARRAEEAEEAEEARKAEEAEKARKAEEAEARKAEEAEAARCTQGACSAGYVGGSIESSLEACRATCVPQAAGPCGSYAFCPKEDERCKGHDADKCALYRTCVEPSGHPANGPARRRERTANAWSGYTICNMGAEALKPIYDAKNLAPVEPFVGSGEYGYIILGMTWRIGTGSRAGYGPPWDTSIPLQCDEAGWEVITTQQECKTAADYSHMDTPIEWFGVSSPRYRPYGCIWTAKGDKFGINLHPDARMRGTLPGELFQACRCTAAKPCKPNTKESWSRWLRKLS